MPRKIENLDWTTETLSDEDTWRFANRVVWPAVNLLHSEEYGINFIHAKNLGEDFWLEESLYSPDGYKSIVVSFEAYCTDKGTDPKRFVPTGSVNIIIEERKIEVEDFLLPNDTALEIWRQKTYSFCTDREIDPVWVDATNLYKDFSGETVQNLSDHQKKALEYLGEDFEESTLSYQDCIDISNVLVVLGAPENYIDSRMRKFNRALKRHHG